jgi:competence protein ComEA
MKEKIKENIKSIIIVISIIIVLLLFTLKNKKQIENEPLELVTEKEEKETEETDISKIKIDIKGEIKHPGVYQLNEGDRVSDAIKISGGLTENADTELINLSKNLKDEMVIIIYNKNEIEKLKQESKEIKTVIEYIEKDCTCPDTINDACIKEAQKQNKNEKKEEIKDKKISLNTGTLEELETLPGIGESKAKQIIKYREENNGFKSIEEIKNISGIGESTFEKFKDNITI